MEEKPKRRWLRFRLRTLLIAVAVISACGGYLRREYLIVQERLEYWPRLNDGTSPVRAISVLQDRRRPIPWVRRVLGDLWWSQMLYFPTDDPDGVEIERLKQLYPEATIYSIPPTPGYESLEGKNWMI